MKPPLDPTVKVCVEDPDAPLEGNDDADLILESAESSLLTKVLVEELGKAGLPLSDDLGQVKNELDDEL